MSMKKTLNGLLLLVLCAVLVPVIQAAPVSAAPKATELTPTVSIVPDGGAMFFEDGRRVSSGAPFVAASADSGTSFVLGAVQSSPLALGAPGVGVAVGADAFAPMVLGAPCWASFTNNCAIRAIVDGVQAIDITTRTCAIGWARDVWEDVPGVGGGDGNDETTSGGTCFKALQDRIFTPVIRGFLIQITNSFREGVKSWMDLTIDLVLKNELGAEGGGGRATEPVVDCNSATGNAQTICEQRPNESKWFIAEFSVMRQLGILLVVPLLMLLVIQSVLKGSLMFLVRAFTIMLPVAILGTVIAVTMTQILLNITDDLCSALIKNLTDIEGYGARFKESVDKMSDDTFGLWGIVWSLMFMIAAFTVFVELLIRELGVYLSTMFLPVAFAGLVWPSSARWARRMVTVLIGLIFSKVLIVAVLTLGMTAFSQSNLGSTNMADTQVIQQLASGQQSPVENGAASLFAGAALFLMAAFAPMRIFSLFEIERTGNIQPSRIMNQGQMVSLTTGSANNFLANINQRRGHP